jgi:PKD repeat protein
MTNLLIGETLTVGSDAHPVGGASSLTPTTPANANDGNSATKSPIPNYVSGGAHADKAWWQVDFGGSPPDVAGVEVVVEVGTGNGSVSALYSDDGSSFTQQTDLGAWSGPATHSDSWATATHRYWRLLWTNNTPAGLHFMVGMPLVEWRLIEATPPVTADFSGTPRFGTAPLSVDFTDLSTNSPTAWAWDFGDGDTDTTQNPTHIYTDPGVYDVALTATGPGGDEDVTKTGYITVTAPPEPGVVVEFADAFVDVSGDIREWTVTRGSGPELTSGAQAGAATITLKNLSDQYNPENAGGPHYGFLHDGPRVWIGVNEDGTITPDPDKDVYGLFAGRITDLSPMPVGGADVAPTVELVCEDPLGWFARQQVTVPPSTLRSQLILRDEVLDALGVVSRDLESEPATLPLSSADGLGLNILDSINASNGTRHFAKPADNSTDWYAYTTVRRTSRLDGTAEASANASDQHVTGTSGWRVSADGVINRQKASVEPIAFPVRRLVWQTDTLPLTVVTGTPLVVWADFGDYVADPVIDAVSTGSSATFVIEPFGTTAKVTITSSGTTSVTQLDIQGNLVQRGSTESVVIDDLTSQALARGIRAGPDLSGDYLGTLTSAKGFAQHIVWRFGNALYRPTMVVENWFPTQFDLDLYDRISLSIAELSITDRIFEIVGLTHHGIVAALDGTTPVAYHTVIYTLQESRVQTPTTWFTLDVSELDGPDLLAY